jgi:hypothetical protein
LETKGEKEDQYMKRILAGIMAIVLLLTNVTFGESVYAKSAVDEHAQTLSLGDAHSSAITEDGSLYMWGYPHL